MSTSPIFFYFHSDIAHEDVDELRRLDQPLSRFIDELFLGHTKASSSQSEPKSGLTQESTRGDKT